MKNEKIEEQILKVKENCELCKETLVEWLEYYNMTTFPLKGKFQSLENNSGKLVVKMGQDCLCDFDDLGPIDKKEIFNEIKNTILEKRTKQQ